MTSHVKLNREEHAGLRIRQGYSAELGDALMWAPVYPREMRDIQACYPIAFVKNAERGGFRPIALFGLEDDENLFLKDGAWDAPYLPLSVRMRPFLIGFAPNGVGGRLKEAHIDLDHPRVSTSEGVPLFEEGGANSPYFAETLKVLADVYDGEHALTGFSAMLEDLSLVEPFALDITLDDGTRGRLEGYYAIAEEKLYNLDAQTLGRLQAAGMLQPIFMAVASLSQFRALIDRRNARIGEAA